MDAKHVVTIDDIRDAAKIIEGQVVRTPVHLSGPLSDLTGAQIYLKLETLQHTGSFKDRGALVKLTSLTETQKTNGVIAIRANSSPSWGRDTASRNLARRPWRGWRACRRRRRRTIP